MGTADWGIWTDPPAVKTASAQIPFSEYNNMIASGNLGYLVTGLQNTSLGHFHDAADSRATFHKGATGFATAAQNYGGASWTNVTGWSALISANIAAMLRWHLSVAMQLTNGGSPGAGLRVTINGVAEPFEQYLQPPGGAGASIGANASWEWWSAVASGVYTAIGQFSSVNDTGNLRARSVVLEMLHTG